MPVPSLKPQEATILVTGALTDRVTLVEAVPAPDEAWAPIPNEPADAAVAAARVMVLEHGTVQLDGEKLAVTPLGSPEAEKETVTAVPLVRAAESLTVLELP